MADIDMMIVVRDDEMKAEAEEDLRKLIDAGKAEVLTFDDLGENLVRWMKPHLDSINESIAKIKKAQTGEDEPEAEEEIPDPTDIGDVIAEAALESWHRKPGGLKPRKPVKKPDPPELHTSEDLEFIPPPEDDLIEATRRTWRKGWRSLFGGDK